MVKQWLLKEVFESNVILDRYKTAGSGVLINEEV